MKHILKLTFLTLAISLSSSIVAQEEIKKEADTISNKQNPTNGTVKKDIANSNSDGGITKSKNEATNDTSGTAKMAIKEQGMPKRNKNKNKNKKSEPITPSAIEPPKKNNSK
jgi:hypothetical protein